MLAIYYDEIEKHRKTGRWYLTARAACDDDTGTAGRARRLRRQQRQQQRTLGAAGSPEVATQNEDEQEFDDEEIEEDEETEEEKEDEEKGEEEDEDGAKEEGQGRVGGRRVGASLTGAGQGQEQEKKNIYSGSGWGLEVMSLQRDWAHVEWSADFLVPDVGGGASGADWGGEAEACLSSAGGAEAFVFRAAAVAEVRARARREGARGVVFLVW